MPRPRRLRLRHPDRAARPLPQRPAHRRAAGGTGDVRGAVPDLALGGQPLVDRYGGAAVARVVLLVEAAGLAVLTAATSEPVALAGVAVTGAGLGLVYPCTTTITLGRTGALRPGAAVGTMTSFWDLGILAAGPLGGQIAANLGYRTAFAAAIAATLAALATAAVLGPRRTVSPAA
ncbi:MFS transporter [Actinomadura yumaensis]|uniref:MFS transporter n=1 Tax=Actinomadura yumaensis TaxID=111807 RepID=UPI00361E818C